MKNSIIVLLTIALLFSLTGCPNKNKYYNARFNSKATNLTEVNSEYDDYNSALPEIHYGRRLIFSSNRTSKGADFDIYDDNFNAIWYMESGTLEISNSNNETIDYFFHSSELINRINKSGNQFGPYFIKFDTLINGHQNQVNFLAYATNANSDKFRSEFVYYITPDEGETYQLVGPDTISFLGDLRQQYISFYGADIMSLDNYHLNPDNFTDIYFDKTENGICNIYRISIPDTLNFIEFLNSNYNFEPELVKELSTNYNDRCPYINGQFIVFASDRPGGKGGYDLYYSKNNGNGIWSEPVNLGEKINSEFDEFRPVTVQVPEFKNDLMIFSSNRPGGKGGFDLYYAGINKIVHLYIE